MLIANEILILMEG